MGLPQRTHLNAYVEALNEADRAVAAALTAQARAREELNERRVEEDLEPLDFDGKPSKKKAPAESEESQTEPAPDEASGFGARTAGGTQ